MTAISFPDIELILGYQFKERTWLEKALTHSSVRDENYERLEFLGDRVLGLVISELIFKKYPQEKEGQLARRFSVLVCGEKLAIIGKEIGIESYILFTEQNNENVIADVMEALLGAMYIDGGFAPCQAMVEKYWATHIETMIEPPQDPKTALQEWAQGRGLGVPDYGIVKREGPDHAPEFTIRVTIQGTPPQEAKGSSRRMAEKQAAQKLLETLL